MRILHPTSLLAILALAVAAPAGASIETVTFQGQITSVPGVFGSAILPGDNLRITVSYNTSSPDLASSGNGLYRDAVVGCEAMLLRNGVVYWTGTLLSGGLNQINVINYSTHDNFTLAVDLAGPSLNGLVTWKCDMSLNFMDPTFFTTDLLPPGAALVSTAVPTQHGLRAYFGPTAGNYFVSCGVDTSEVVIPCPSDLNDDGVTDGSDLGLMLGAWGTPNADMNGDGTTDGADLGFLLGAWGGC